MMTQAISVPAARALFIVALLFAAAASRVHAQGNAPARDSGRRQPPTVPTIVALSMTIGTAPFGEPQFFSGEVPTDWPSTLVPAGATAVGGGTLGDSLFFRLRVAVFDLGAVADPSRVTADLVARAGFTERRAGATPGGGGFVSTTESGTLPRHCRGSAVAAFGVPDSVHSPGVVSIHLIDGAAGRQLCEDTADQHPGVRPLIPIPVLTPPRGAALQPVGSGSSGEGGYTRAMLRTTMPADSVLAHFTAQLVAGGWRADGSPGAAPTVGAQRFLVRHGEEEWAAALFVMMVGERHTISLEYTRRM